jgi:hypothetical protein
MTKTTGTFLVGTDSFYLLTYTNKYPICLILTAGWKFRDKMSCFYLEFTTFYFLYRYPWRYVTEKQEETLFC